MRLVPTILFWVAVGWVFYVFIGYTLLMALLSRLRPRPLARCADYRPRIALVMAAYNEERNITERLENYLDLDYPRELLSFLIGSDGSTDGTDAIIERYCAMDPSMTLQRFNRVGKTRIIYDLAARTDADVILFTDADIVFANDALKVIAGCMSDPTVGGVIGRMSYRDSAANAGNRGQGKYLQLENRLRAWESLFWTTVGPSGECFAVRRGSYSPMTDYRLSDDNHLVITIPLNGLRVWYEPTLAVVELNKRSLETESRRRLRMGQQATATFLAHPETRWPWRSLVGFEIWSHKLLRNLVAIPIWLLALCALLLAPGSTFFAAVAAMVLLWGLAMLGGYIGDRLSVNVRLLQYPLYFTSMLNSLAIGSVRAVFSGGLDRWNSPRM
ncbi:MAG: glycosyltransferase [Bacteroidetes bacterium]|nr:glycosyltransferase [Bacteroidota bacterium]